MSDVSVVFSGEAGQGLQTLETLMMKLFKLSGYHVYSYSEFMSRIRGGNNSTQIRVSSMPVAAYLKRIDIFVPIRVGAMERFHDRITNETVIIGQKDHIDADYLKGHYPVIEMPMPEMVKRSGGEIYTNVILLGVFSGLFYIEKQLMADMVKDLFSAGDQKDILRNLTAAQIGYEAGTRLLKPGQASINIERSKDAKQELLLNGINAVGLGGLAGGCNFVSSYPMSPSTAVLSFFAEKAEEFGVVVEQAEDEISAINMAMGAWYAGGRAMVTTSGGGYALMVEGLSLAGCIESPLVIHVGQRPGPATGLPTRTEQADLEHVLYSGHGEFPRVILAPGTIEQGFFLTRHAFYLADKYQVPVFILTDQYFLESRYIAKDIDATMVLDQHYIVKTQKGYRRYAFTDDGISPRGIPGFGVGRVRVDSDEHDESGFITEDLQTREDMVEKRLKKIVALDSEILPPSFTGPKDYRYLIMGWGSTYHAIREALDMLGRDDIAFLHFSQIYPLSRDIEAYLDKADKKIIVENNATSQFGKLIRFFTGVEFDAKVLRYGGMPVMPEDIFDVVKDIR